jgi:hypothetical protein
MIYVLLGFAAVGHYAWEICCFVLFFFGGGLIVDLSTFVIYFSVL